MARGCPTGELAIECGLGSDVGRQRPHNEDWADYYEPREEALLASHGRLYLVADGMGGAAAGEIASQYAVRKVLFTYYKQLETLPPDARLVRAIEEANADIYEHASKAADRRGMGTTLVAALVLGDCLVIANVGDSRAYLVRDETLAPLTRDHSLVAEMVRDGLISEEQARTHPRRNVITRSIGTKDSVAVDVFQRALEPGDKILLCTDGLVQHVGEDEILEAICAAQPAAIARRLVALANGRGGSDNITILVLALGDWRDAREIASSADRERPEAPRLG